MSIFENLTKVFNVELRTIGIDNSIVICFENINSPTSTDTPFLSGFMLNAPVSQADLSVNEFRQGIYQIDINYAENLGSAPINRMADIINQTFKTGEYFTRGTICVGVESVSLERLVVAGGWATRSMSIAWTSYTQRL